MQKPEDYTVHQLCGATKEAQVQIWKGYSNMERILLGKDTLYGARNAISDFTVNASEISLNVIKNMHGDQWICTQCQEEETVPAMREKAKSLDAM